MYQGVSKCLCEKQTREGGEVKSSTSIFKEVVMILS